MNPVIETIILVIQVIIVALQLYLSYQINRQNISNNKGYFIPGATNIPHPREYQTRFRGRFDLGRNIPFELTGNDGVNILSHKIALDNKTLVDTKGNYQPVFFTRERDLDIFECRLPLTEDQLKQTTIDILVTLRMENMSGYKYNETIHMGFGKVDDMQEWVLNKVNIAFT